jgi:hypothetical protein
MMPRSVALTRTLTVPRTLTLALTLAACAAEPDPYCADYGTGGPMPGVPLCRDLHLDPVCDDEGDMARWELDGAGVHRLVGGTLAICDDALQVVCAVREVVPYCLPQPVDG